MSAIATSLRLEIFRERPGRVKPSLAPLAADAGLTRPARSQGRQLPERRGILALPLRRHCDQYEKS